MKTFSAVLGVLTVLAFGVYFIAGSVVSDEYIEQERLALQFSDLEQRLQPVGKVVVAGSAEAEAEAQTVAMAAPQGEASGGAPDGAAIYQANCTACHQAGALNAPVTGDQDVWTARYDEKGLDTLVSHAINGFNQMPAKGGNTSLSDDEVRASVVYMLQESGIEIEDTTTAADSATEQPAEQQQAAADSATEQPAEQQQAAAADSATEQPAEQQQAAADSATEQPAEQAQQSADPASEEPAAAASAGELIPASVDLQQGEETYGVACVACHGQGLAGAPKLSDQAAWESRKAKGWDTLAKHVLEGFKGMPAKGGRVDLPDEQITNALGYMLKQTQ